MSSNNNNKQLVQRHGSVLSYNNSIFQEEMGGNASDQLFFVTSYSDFDKLAHGPRGSAAKHPLHVYRFHPSDGSLVLLNIQGDASTVINPAFSRHHPICNVVYTCTEDTLNNGQIFAYKVGQHGELTQLGEAVNAGGTSSCYLTIDKQVKHLLVVNYWDSTLSVIPLNPDGSFAGPICNQYDPKQGAKMIAGARCEGGVNHSFNDDSTIRMRQADPHSHALVLDPFVGSVAYVPDLGKDLVREFLYRNGEIVAELNCLPSGLSSIPHGPRYFEFHPEFNVAYVVNELSSTVSVFEVDKELLHELATAENIQDYKGRSTLRLIQTIKTVPSAFPTTMNTCGRICVHKSGQFVVVSNRGHQSIVIFKVIKHGKSRGELVTVGYFHTRGETPRHFQFDNSGQYLIVANQDTDSLAVFNFNLCSGTVTYTGNEYRVPSPNFVCNVPYRDDIPDTVVTVSNLSSVMDQQKQQQESFASSSENSTTNAVSCEENGTLKLELEKARKEIELLREQLGRLTH